MKKKVSILLLSLLVISTTSAFAKSEVKQQDKFKKDQIIIVQRSDNGPGW
ncbi:hypothetical protein ACFYU8_18460 [Brevibacillus sp. NPDC003359]